MFLFQRGADLFTLNSQEENEELHMHTTLGWGEFKETYFFFLDAKYDNISQRYETYSMGRGIPHIRGHFSPLPKRRAGATEWGMTSDFLVFYGFLQTEKGEDVYLLAL